MLVIKCVTSRALPPVAIDNRGGNRPPPVTRLSRWPSQPYPEHTKPTIGRREVFSVCSAPLAEVGPRLLFFGPIRHVESVSELVGQSGHLIILIGCSAGEPVYEKGAEWMCSLAIGCRASAWCVRATLDPDAADVSRPRSLLSSPLVRRRRLGVFRAWCVDLFTIRLKVFL